MKKFSIVLCIALCLCLAACQSQVTAPQTTTAAPLATVAPTQAIENTETPVTPAPTPTQAETATPSPEPTPAAPTVVQAMEPIHFDESAPLSYDLDGDGSQETISIVTYDTPYESLYALQVNDVVFEAGSRSDPHGMLCDLNSDGKRIEIFFTGDVASDDYETWCLNWNGTALTVTPFADNTGHSGENGVFYGSFVGVAGENVIMETWMNTLGTWGAQRLYTLGTDNLIAYAENPWTRPEEMLAQADLWAEDSHWILETKAELPYTRFEANVTSEATLPAGTRLIVIGTDTLHYADFLTEDGIAGRFYIERREIHGVTVSGTGEEDAFVSLFYAG